jgi:hypothetical protein
MSDTLNIFISHKHEYEPAARAIKSTLSKWGAKNVKVFISEEIPPGEDWFKWIQDRLAESNILLLLFTEPTLSWDWCLYEAGLFQHIDGTDFRRVICLHSPQTDPPRPLKHLQAVRAEPEKVKEFLKTLYGATTLTGQSAPINPAVAEDDEELAAEAQKICRYFGPIGKRKTHFNKFLRLRVRNPAALGPASIPDEAAVESNATSLEIFGLAEGIWRWRDLVEAQARRSGDARWLDELVAAIHLASQNRLFMPIQAKYCAGRGEAYRPVLMRADAEADGSMTFHVLFVDEVAGSVDELPLPLATMLTALWMGTRFRFEVIERCLDALRKARAGDDVPACEAVKRAMLNIEKESQSRGAELSRESLTALFADAGERAEIGSLYERWYPIRKAMFDAMERHSVGDVERQILALRRLNARFMALASARLHELMVEHTRADPEEPLRAVA